MKHVRFSPVHKICAIQRPESLMILINGTMLDNLRCSSGIGSRSNPLLNIYCGPVKNHHQPWAAITLLCRRHAGHCDVNNVAGPSTLVSACDDDVYQWMKSIRLQLNSNKSEVILITTVIVVTSAHLRLCDWEMIGFRHIPQLGTSASSWTPT